MNTQRRQSAMVEEVPEDPSRPDGPKDIYLIFDGRRIAKRGKPGTLHARQSRALWFVTFPWLKANLDGAQSQRSTTCVCIDLDLSSLGQIEFQNAESVLADGNGQSSWNLSFADISRK